MYLGFKGIQFIFLKIVSSLLDKLKKEHLFLNVRQYLMILVLQLHGKKLRL